MKGLQGWDAAERQAVLLSVLTYESQQSPSCCCVSLYEELTGGTALHFYFNFPSWLCCHQLLTQERKRRSVSVAMEKPLSLCHRLPSGGHIGPLPTIPLPPLQPHLSASFNSLNSLNSVPIQYFTLISMQLRKKLMYLCKDVLVADPYRWYVTPSW